MAQLWTATTKKWYSTIALILSAWYVLAMNFEGVPLIPEIVTKPLIGQFSILVIAAMFTLFTVFILHNDY